MRRLIQIILAASALSFAAQAEPVRIHAASRTAPPAWALLQRRLISTMNGAAEVYLRKMTQRGGAFLRHGKVDDDYESFANWPLFYAMGGDEKLLDWALQEFNAVTRQWTYERDSLHKEFVKSYDPLHLSEGYLGFQYFGLADPAIGENAGRARRFAGFYLDEDPAARNYDPRLRILRSPFTGSLGPSFHSDCQYVLNYGHASLYPLIEKLEPGWDSDPRRRAEVQKLYDDVVMRGDIPANLAITGLVTHACILTGDEKYRRWVLDYVDGWMERIRRNNGVIPDNVGLSGKIGEYRNGQWWGGLFGWNSRYSIEIIFNALITAAENAQLISGDAKYLDLLRSQVDVLLTRAKMREGNLVIPYKYGPQGWGDYRPMEPHIVSHLWHASMDAADWERIERLRRGARNGPLPYARADSPDPPPSPEAEMWDPDGTLVDWNRVRSDIPHRNQNRHNEAPHLSYLGGTNPEWPEKIMRAEFEQVMRCLDHLRTGAWEHPWRSQTVTEQNPVFTNGLAQMTMGAPHTSFNGGLLQARVRYFDPERRRPGLPADVAALVEKLAAGRTVLQLVNLNALESRRVIVQAGAFGEHQFTQVAAGGASPVAVNARFFEVDLPPSTAIRLEAGTRRFVNRPSYAFPWQAAQP